MTAKGKRKASDEGSPSKKASPGKKQKAADEARPSKQTDKGEDSIVNPRRWRVLKEGEVQQGPVIYW